ncbi:hypothetical protein GGS21DRAFT_545858 [Xylaria nigripes]|nr:hypothetical protein GGS21DRAFT_545858 [Xylaria nigripes]
MDATTVLPAVSSSGYLKRKAFADAEVKLLKFKIKSRPRREIIQAKEGSSDNPSKSSKAAEPIAPTAPTAPTASTALVVSAAPSAAQDEAPPVEPTEDTDPLTYPLPVGTPPVCSNVRAALCDSIDYWRAHQGGIQSTKNKATGMLLNGKTTPRDVLQAQVIVTTVGGGLKTAADGKHIRTEDQGDKNRNYVSLKNAMDVGEPIGVVAGKQAGEKGYSNNLLRVRLENHFNVLAWFFITDIWTEYQPIQRDGSRFKHYCVRLQKIDLQSVSWWVPRDSETLNMHTIGEFQCPKFACVQCNHHSKEIFREGWCCLMQSCPKFFCFMRPDVDIDNLQYNKNFLNERKEWVSTRPLGSLVPRSIEKQPNEFGSEERFKRGLICPTCRFASRRISWDGWMCEKGCGYKVSMPPLDVPMSLVHEETEKQLKRRQKYFEVDSRLLSVQYNVCGYEVSSFFLPNVQANQHEASWIGSVTVFRPKQSALERAGGLNELFQEIQEATRLGDVKLERRPAFCRGSHMEELTSHFSCNMGADYKFGVVVETSNGFETAPAPIMKALGRLTWGGSTAVELTAKHVSKKALSIDSQSMPDNFIDFNEELMLGYFQKSQISFHDDGEKELGPTVATLSLGSPSTMRFRCKAKTNKMEDTVGANGILLSIVLEHGDMVIMHGTKIHQYYEHAVMASGIRRYALTCRYIRPELIPNAERREKALVNGKVPDHWRDRAYKGETPDALLREAALANELQSGI